MRKTRGGVVYQQGGLPPSGDHVAIEPTVGGFTLSVVAGGETTRDADIYQDFSKALRKAGARARERDFQEIFIVE